MTTLAYGAALLVAGIFSAVIASERGALGVFVAAISGAAVGCVVAIIGVGQMLGGAG